MTYLHGPWGITGAPHDGGRIRGSQRGVGGHMDAMQFAEAYESGVAEVRMGLDLGQQYHAVVTWYVLSPPFRPRTL